MLLASVPVLAILVLQPLCVCDVLRACGMCVCVARINVLVLLHAGVEVSPCITFLGHGSTSASQAVA